MTPAWPVELTIAEISRLQRLEALAKRWAHTLRATRSVSAMYVADKPGYLPECVHRDAERALLALLEGE